MKKKVKDMSLNIPDEKKTDLDLAPIRFVGYTTGGVIVINVLLYFAYYISSAIFTKPDVIFIYKLTGDELFPLWGFGLAISVGVLMGAIIFLGTFLKSLSLQLFMVSLAFLSAILLSLTFLPFSISICSMYIGLCISIVAIIIFRHHQFAYPTLTIYGVKYPASDSRSVVESVKQTHQVWLTIFRESLVMVVAYIVIGGISLSLNQLIRFFPPYSEETGMYVTFSRLQIVTLLFVIVYCAFGILAWISVYAYNKLISVQNVLNNLALETMEGYKHVNANS